MHLLLFTFVGQCCVCCCIIVLMPFYLDRDNKVDPKTQFAYNVSEKLSLLLLRMNA